MGSVYGWAQNAVEKCDDWYLAVLSGLWCNNAVEQKRLIRVIGGWVEPANKLNIESLSQDWCDKDIVMLHACFQLLCDCIEKEGLFRLTDWTVDERHIQDKQAIEALYQWWLQRRDLDDAVDQQHPQYEQDNQKLIELIRLRHLLWT